MRFPTRTAGLAGVAAVAMLATTACSGGGATTTTGAGASTTSGSSAATALSIRGCTPENPLIGTSTNEVCGGNVIDAISAKLVHYNPDTAAPELDIAQSIETTDNKLFTVKLKDYKFSDGTQVKAKNFVDAWNWGAYGPNGQLNGYFFEPIAGYADLQCTGPATDSAGKAADPCAGAGAPKAKEMTGLKVVDDTTFTISTTEPVSNLKVRLGYSAFTPQPDAFFADTDPKKANFAKLPVAAGPYKIVENTDQAMVLQKNPNYSGSYKGSVDKVTFKIYNDTNAAYNDVVANNLDVTDVIPADQLTGDAWKTDLAGRSAQRETGIIQTITFSSKDEQLKSTDMRKALSMAIDRALITKQIFNGARIPATGFVSPVVDGYKAGVCGENCTFDAAKAKELYTKAGGYKGTLTLAVNGDGGHKLWADAVCNQLKTTLGVDCQTTITPDFKTLRKQINAREIKGLFRTGWQMDYPSIENFLTPLYATKASSNDGDYSNPKFDQLLKDAAAATDNAKANELYQQAEAVLAQDMPVIPLWYQSSQFGWSTKVKKIKMTPFSTFDLTSVEMA